MIVVVLKLLLLGSIFVADCSGQACANTCPPLDDSGSPIESLCVGDTLTESTSFTYQTCYPTVSELSLASLATQYDVIVVSNYYVGCNAGRRESGVYAYSSQRLHDANERVVFVSAIHGGGCSTWGGLWESFGESTFDYPITTMPLTISDDDYR